MTVNIRIIRREYEPGRYTNDVFVDGLLYVSAVGDAALPLVLSRIARD
jgi:hypothetical protein